MMPREVFWGLLAVVVVLAFMLFDTGNRCADVVPVPMPISVQVEPIFPLPPAFPTRPRQ